MSFGAPLWLFATLPLALLAVAFARRDARRRAALVGERGSLGGSDAACWRAWFEWSGFALVAVALIDPETQS